jgi:hypothetical protein
LNPNLALVPTPDRICRKINLKAQNPARHVVPRSSLDDGVLGDKDAPDRNPETRVPIRHQVSADNSIVRCATGKLTPETLFASSIELIGKKGVGFHLHRSATWKNIVGVTDFLGLIFEGHLAWLHRLGVQILLKNSAEEGALLNGIVNCHMGMFQEVLEPSFGPGIGPSDSMSVDMYTSLFMGTKYTKKKKARGYLEPFTLKGLGYH